MSVDKKSNLFAEYDDAGTEANQEIIENVQVRAKTKAKEQFNKDIKNVGTLLNEINNQGNSNKIDSITSRIEAKKLEDKKSYATYYLKNSSKNKLLELSKKWKVSKGEALDIIINNFDN